MCEPTAETTMEPDVVSGGAAPTATAKTLELRLFGPSGNLIHDVIEWTGAGQSRLTYRWGRTRCGMLGKTYDVDAWRRAGCRPCKVCESRRAAVS